MLDIWNIISSELIRYKIGYKMVLRELRRWPILQMSPWIHAAVGRFTGFTSRTTGLCGPRNFHHKLYDWDLNVLLYLGLTEIALFYGEKKKITLIVQYCLRCFIWTPYMNCSNRFICLSEHKASFKLVIAPSLYHHLHLWGLLHFRVSGKLLQVH